MPDLPWRTHSPIQFSVTTAVITSVPIPGVQRAGVAGVGTCQTCGALVLTSSGEAIDLHAAWHAAQEAPDA